MKFFTLGFLLFVPILMFSQQTRPFTVGWLVGIEQSGPVSPVDSTYFTATESGNIQQGNKITGTAGLRLEGLLGGNATIRLDVLYADRGYIEDVRFSQSGGPQQQREDRFRFGYLSLPLTARIPLHSGDAFMYATGGILAERLLFTSSRTGTIAQDSFEPWALGWKAGLGANYPFSNESRGFFEIGITRGLSEYRMGRDWQPRSFSLVLGWMY